MSLFGAHLTVLRQPLKAAGRSTAAAEKLLALVTDLPDGCALALSKSARRATSRSRPRC